jgi:hypothetical protein
MMVGATTVFVFFRAAIFTMTNAALFQNGHKHVFETAAILIWYQHAIEQGRVPSNPVTKLPFARTDMKVDVGLQKVIARRLRALKANGAF